MLLLLWCLAGCAKTHNARIEQRSYIKAGFERLDGNSIPPYASPPFFQQIYGLDDSRFASTIVYNGVEYYIGESMEERMELTKTPLSFEGSDVYTWFEVRGAACGCTRFMSIYEGEPVLLLELDGFVSYHDFDDDGADEIVVSYVGINPSKIDVVLWNEDEQSGVGVLDVNAALKADYGVRYADGRFYATLKRDNPSEIEYVFDGAGFKKAG